MSAKRKAKATPKKAKAKKAAKAKAAKKAKPNRSAARKAVKGKTTARKPTPRAGANIGLGVIERLKKRWTSSLELQKELNWQPHTLRGFLSGCRTKGMNVESERRGEAGTFYRIT